MRSTQRQLAWMTSFVLVCLLRPSGAFSASRNALRGSLAAARSRSRLQPLRCYRTEGPEYVYGVAPVRLALQARRRKMYELYVQQGVTGSQKKDKTAVDAIQQLASALGVPTLTKSKHDLNMLTDSRPHQGFVLKAEPLRFQDLDALPQIPAVATSSADTTTSRQPCWLILDEVMDPQNFGALLRTAHFLGIDGVVTCAKNSAPLSPVVSKASAGAMEAMTVHSTPNLMKFIDKSRLHGWNVLGAALEERAVEISEVVVDKPTALILGNEGSGLRTNVKTRCSALVKISSAAPSGTASGSSEEEAEDVDSLNVSVTGGIMLHHFVRSAKSATR